MRTTINLPDQLILDAKKAALEANTTFTEIIADALREALTKRSRKMRTKKKTRLITYGKGGAVPGIDLDKSAELLDFMGDINDSSRR
jgi:hypothetical protein